MIYSIIVSILFVITFYFAIKRSQTPFKIGEILRSLRNSVSRPMEMDSILFLISFALLMILPLFWGLTFYLTTDANVVVVILTLTWIYNWIKYTFFISEEKDSN